MQLLVLLLVLLLCQVMLMLVLLLVLLCRGGAAICHTVPLGCSYFTPPQYRQVSNLDTCRVFVVHGRELYAQASVDSGAISVLICT